MKQYIIAPLRHVVTSSFLFVALLVVPAMAQQVQQPAESGQVETLTVDPIDKTPEQVDLPQDRIDFHLIDPNDAVSEFERLLDEAREKGNREDIKLYERTLERVKTIRRSQRMELTLEDVIRRTLENSYAIEISGFSPAIEQTRVVEAEAAFDMVFYTDITKSLLDRPTGSQLAPNTVDTLNMEFGVRKLLPTGAQAQLDYGLQRQFTSLEFQTVNPEWFSDLAFQVRQPLLRGAGIDYNLSVIRISKNTREIEDWQFKTEVRDRLQQVEQLYWALVAARYNVVISARVLAEFEQLYDYLIARKDFDITPVQIAATRANLETSRAQFVQVQAEVFNAEDRLITAMNDPELDLAQQVEIVPADFPSYDLILVNRLAEAKSALESRSEIKQQELALSSAKLQVHRARNQELPQLDLTLGYTVNGLGVNSDTAFDQTTQLEYIDYFIGVNFEIPVGNRARRAATRRAQLQMEQAIASLKGAIETVIFDVNLAVRELHTKYNQIGPSFESTEARNREVDSIIARAERKDINTLNSELSARQNLASARRSLLQAMIDYNNALVELERSKGTLLDFYNVTIDTEDD